jgi:hypothetical protein
LSSALENKHENDLCIKELNDNIKKNSSIKTKVTAMHNQTIVSQRQALEQKKSKSYENKKKDLG